MNAEEKFQTEEFQNLDEAAEVSESADELVPIAICFDLAEAESIKNFLEGKDLQVVATSWDDSEIEDLAAHIDKGVNLNVFTEDNYEATMLLDGFRAGQEAARGIEVDNGWGSCPQCRSKNLVIISDAGFGESIWDFITTFSAKRVLRCDDCKHEWETEKQ